jgi:urea transport system ATP-binding protein
MLLVQDAQLLMLDEPVAGMSSDEREQTGKLLQRIAEDRTVVIVEHDMDFMRSFAKSVTVLAAGRILSEGTVAQVQADPKVQEVYLGTASHASGTDAAAVELIAAQAEQVEQEAEKVTSQESTATADGKVTG